MDKKRKIIENLIGSFFFNKTSDENEIYEETNLILGYLNETLDKKERQEIESRISNDDEFRFRLEMIRYEIDKQIPKYRLVKLLIKLKAVKNSILEAIKFDKLLIGWGYSGSQRNLQIKYLVPISLTATAAIVFALLINTATYNFMELSSSRSFFINNTWRGEEKDKVEDSYKPVIQYKNDKLLLNWVSTNLNTESYTVSINQVEYNIDEGTLSIDNYKFQTDTLRIEITEFFDNQPITKFSGVYLITK